MTIFNDDYLLQSINIITRTENNMCKAFSIQKKINKLITVVAFSVIDSILLNKFHFNGIV